MYVVVHPVFLKVRIGTEQSQPFHALADEAAVESWHGSLLQRALEMHPTARDVYGEPVVIGVKLEVDPEQAKTVRRIFERYLSDHSLKRIALDLNDDGVVSPQPQKGRPSQTWCPSSVRRILRNERYRGVVIWGKNSLLVARRALEEQLLAGLQQRVLHPDVVDYTLRRFEEELAKALRSKGSELDARRRHAQTIERKIVNLTRALSDGYSPAITNELAQLERQLADAAGRLADFEPIAIERRMRDARRFVESRLANLQTLFGAEAVTIRAEIAKHVQTITLTPEGRTYVASGTWDLLGAAAWMVPGGPGMHDAATG